MSPALYRLFDVCGVEIEYMLVRRDTFAVDSAADEVLRAGAGSEAFTCSAEFPDITWSNELVLHVLELKVTEPARALAGLAAQFQAHIRRINGLLAARGSQLMPSGAHPWMNPARDARLWPHEYAECYQTFDRIFGCRTHGWTNLQSVHVNLPFANDAEFGSLHAAIRLLLPILPALSASTPFLDARFTGMLDARLEAYRSNAAGFPLVAGAVIPEPCFTRQAYRRRILQPLYRQLAPVDPRGELCHEWANARGAIARFERSAIEIRVLDAQECPQADLAIVHAVVHVLKALTSERWTGLAEQQAWPVEPLSTILRATSRDAEQAFLDDPAFLRQFGWPGPVPCQAGALWTHLLEQAVPREAEFDPALDVLRSEGPLARRMLRAVGETPDRAALESLCRSLCACLADGRLFRPAVS